jgi:hypothetical protein
MGGYGSGRWHGVQTRLTVESCLVLSIDDLRRAWRRDSTLIVGVWGWKEQEASIRFQLECNADGVGLRLHYQTRGEDIDELVPIERQSQPFGGRRWWFNCPAFRDGRHCGRRCSKLYLPPGGRVFACRRCYNLTYASCNESRRFDTLYRVLASNMGIGASEVRQALRGMAEL